MVNMMDQKSKKIFYFALLAATLLVAVAAAGIMTLGHTTDNTHTPGISMETTKDSRDLFPDKAYPEYAKGYSVEYHGTYKVVQIHDPWGRQAENQTYLLVQRGEKVPDGYPEARVFFIPVTSVIALSATQLSYITELNETSSIKGINNINLVYDQALHELVRKGKILEIGSGTLSMASSLKTETMIELEPDVAFCSATGNREYDNQYKLQEAGLKPAITAESSENHLLGRAEWIKYYALYYNKEKMASEVFERIQTNYTAIRVKTKNVTYRPTLFSGIDYQGTWYAPGGNSYVAQLFRDAGGDYVLVNDTKSGDKPLDLEIVYERAHDAEFWINTGVGDDIERLLALDSRYSKFTAVKTGRIYHFTARVNVYSGNDYWQSGIIHPDIILADLVKILHPELLPDHELYYYRHIGANQTGASR